MVLFSSGNIPRSHHQTYRLSSLFSLLCGLLGIYGLSESLSCVTYTDEQRDFLESCGIRDIKLQRHWCWEPARQSKLWEWCCAMGLLIDVVLVATGQFTLFISQRLVDIVPPPIWAPMAVLGGQKLANRLHTGSHSRKVDKTQRGTAGLWGFSKLCNVIVVFEITREITSDYKPWGVLLRCMSEAGRVVELRVDPESEVFGVRVPTSAPSRFVAICLAWGFSLAACALRLCTKLDWVDEDAVSKDIVEEAKRLEQASTSLVSATEAGERVLPVADQGGLALEDSLWIGRGSQAELHRITGFRAASIGVLTVDRPLDHEYAPGSTVTVKAQCRVGHLVLPEERDINSCDGCGARGTSFRCQQGCDFDLCGRCGDKQVISTIAAGASRGDVACRISSQVGFSLGDMVEISGGGRSETRAVKSCSSSIVLESPTVRRHREGTRLVKQASSTSEEIGYEVARKAKGGGLVFRKISLVKRLMTQPDVRLRVSSMFLHVLASWLGLQAYMADWLCVSEITVAESHGHPFDASQLGLLGACGKPSGVSVLELFSIWPLGILIVIQFLLAFSWKGDRVTFLVNKLPMELEAMLHKAARGREELSRETILCYVWVKKQARQRTPELGQPGFLADQDGKRMWLERTLRRAMSGSGKGFSDDPLDRIVCDCTRTEGDRRSWRRSAEPVSVRVLTRRQFEEYKHDWKDEQKRLTRGMGFPNVYVEIPCPRKDAFSQQLCLYQIIPKEFVCGSFMVELSLGSKAAYLGVYNFCSAMVFAMIFFDIFVNFHWLNHELGDCHDILSGSCTSVDTEALKFHRSVGYTFAVMELLLAVCGSLLAVKANRTLHVLPLRPPRREPARAIDCSLRGSNIHLNRVSLRMLLSRTAASAAPCSPACRWLWLGSCLRNLRLPLAACRAAPQEQPLLAAFDDSP